MWLSTLGRRQMLQETYLWTGHCNVRFGWHHDAKHRDQTRDISLPKVICYKPVNSFNPKFTNISWSVLLWLRCRISTNSNAQMLHAWNLEPITNPPRGHITLSWARSLAEWCWEALHWVVFRTSRTHLQLRKLCRAHAISLNKYDWAQWHDRSRQQLCVALDRFFWRIVNYYWVYSTNFFNIG